MQMSFISTRSMANYIAKMQMSFISTRSRANYIAKRKNNDVAKHKNKGKRG